MRDNVSLYRYQMVTVSFLKSEDAVFGLFEAIARFHDYNQTRDLHERFISRAGMNQGPAILVNLNDRIDYFGGTVNRAAQYESLSGENELTFSESILKIPGIGHLLKGYGIQSLRRRRLNIKGMDGVNTACTLSPGYETREPAGSR